MQFALCLCFYDVIVIVFTVVMFLCFYSLIVVFLGVDGGMLPRVCLYVIVCLFVCYVVIVGNVFMCVYVVYCLFAVFVCV